MKKPNDYDGNQQQLCCCLGSCNSGTKQELANTVHLKGQLLDMGSQNVRMRFDGAASMLGDSRDILLKTDAAGYFDTTFVLKEPTYYTISRNTLYLTPGDDMTIKVTQTNTEAEFSGIGAEANNYMKFRLFSRKVVLIWKPVVTCVGILCPLKRWLTAWPLYVCIHWIR